MRVQGWVPCASRVSTEGNVARIRIPMETESDALIGGQRLCADPSRKMVIGLRANLSVVADALKVDIVAAVKGEAQRGLA